MSKKNPTTDNNSDLEMSGSLVEAASNRRKEWRFALPLNAVVEGSLPDGKSFREDTILENISSTGAYFGLDAKITVGCRLTLIIDLPARLTEGKAVRLRLEGSTVRLQRLHDQPKQQGIALNFEEEYQFSTEEKAEA